MYVHAHVHAHAHDMYMCACMYMHMLTCTYMCMLHVTTCTCVHAHVTTCVTTCNHMLHVTTCNHLGTGDIATRCGAFSKALHYRENEVHTTGGTQAAPRLVEALVSLHNSLSQPEAALGVLQAAQRQHNFSVQRDELRRFITEI